MEQVSAGATVRAMLDDAAFTVTPVPTPAPRGTLRWLRTQLPRFSEGEAHGRRRETAELLLAGLDPAALRKRAAAQAHSLADRDIAEEAVLDAVPPLVLAEGLGMLHAGLDEGALVRAVATVAASYQPYTPQATDVDAQASVLLEAAPGGTDEERAIRVGLLLQACPAVATLVRHARRSGSAPDATAHAVPPVPVTRRVAPEGRVLELDLAGVPFGAGRHACPGESHALAIAMGVLDALGGAGGAG